MLRNLLLILAVISCHSLLQLNFTDWLFKIPSKYNKTAYPAKIPSTIHIDLLENKLIEDPFYRNNQEDIQWIHEVSVIYQTNFTLNNEWENITYFQLVFEGLDTYANITLNGIPLRSTNNSFVKYTIPVTDVFVNEKNRLQVSFNPSQSVDDQLQLTQIELPFAYGHTRKAPYQYGWDWAPKMITVGIWRPAYILGFQKARIDYVWARNRLITPDKAVINFATVLHKPSEMVSLASSQSYNISVLLGGVELVSAVCKQVHCYVDAAISSPKLWWPRSVGTPNMYDFIVQLKDGENIIDTKRIPYGIRTVELNQTDGAFQVIVNGYPIYSKGANYVPADMFHPRFANAVHNPVYTLEQLFEDIAESNMNMIRIWGGGQYETDEFYEAASRKGIMLFSEFMFSVNTYPGDRYFLRNCEEEAKQQVRRLRNYPALALWSGNNEVLQGINEWGWMSDQSKQNYDLLFQKLLRKVIEIQNPDISYIPTSPLLGNGEATESGDIHYWNIWSGQGQFQNYLTRVGRFNSQFGTQAFPVWQTIEQFTLDEDRNYESEVMLSHQKFSSKFDTLKKYISDYFNEPNTFEDAVYISGLTQGYAIKLAIAAHRVAKNKTWGTLYWQLNDAWTSISWSSIDYFGRWKPLQYVVKNHYKDVALFIQDFQNQNKSIKYIAVNDRLQTIKTIVNIKVLTIDGEILFNSSKSVELQPNQAKLVHLIHVSDLDTLLNGSLPSQVVFFGEIISSKNLSMQSTFYIGRPKDVQLKQATLTVNYNTETNSIKLNSSSLIKNLYITHPQQYIKLSNNYMDIIPGIETTVTLANLSAFKDNLAYKSVLQTYTNIPLHVNIV